MKFIHLLYTLFFSIIIAAGVFKWQFEENRHTIASDGNGYYAYLPAVFIYQDLSFKETTLAEAKYHRVSYKPIYLHQDEKGNVFNKYFPGTAVLQAPFFIAAQLQCFFIGIEDTGYNWVHDYWTIVGSVFYLIFGIVLLYRLLSLFTKNRTAIIITLIGFGVGSSLVYQSLFTPSYSHGISFFLITLLYLKFNQILNLNKKNQNLLYFGIILGLIVLVRPVNIICIVFLPILLNTSDLKTQLIQFIKHNWRKLSITLLGFLSIVMLLFLINFLQTGNYFNWSYKGEGFNFLKPHFFDILFSYRTGLFTSLPFLLLFWIGIYIKRKSFLSLKLIIYFTVLTYLVSSWWSYDYGGYYGNRVYIEHYQLFAIPIALAFDKMLSKKWTLILPLLFCIFTLIRFYQLNNNIIVSRFTKESYFDSMWKLKDEHINAFKFSDDCMPFGEKVIKRNVLNYPETIIFSKEKEFGIDGNIRIDTNFIGDYYLEVKLDKKLDDTDWKEVLLICVAQGEENEIVHYFSYPLYNSYIEGKQKYIDFRIGQRLYFEHKKATHLNIYFWNKDRKQFKLKNIEANIISVMHE